MESNAVITSRTVSRLCAPVLQSKPRKSNDESMSFLELISYGDWYDKLLMLAGTLGALGCGSTQPLLIVFVGECINVVDPRKFSSNDNLISEVSAICLKIVYTAFGAALASVLEVAAWIITAERQSARIRLMYLKALLRQDLSYFDQEFSAGESMSKISGDVLLIQDALGDKVGNVIESFAKFVGGWTFGFLKSWRLAVVTVSVLPLVVIVGGMIALGLKRAASKAQYAYSEAGKVVDQVLGSIRTVASNTGERKAVAQYDAALVKAEHAGFTFGCVNGFGIGLTLCLMFCSYGLAMWYGSRLVANGNLSGGTVIGVIFAIIMGGAAAGQAVPHLSAISTGLRAAQSIFYVIKRKPEIDSDDMSGDILTEVKGELQLKDVHFAYPSRPDQTLFRNFSLHIKAGSVAALVGQSGSGKSTVIQLIERFYDPQIGQVLLDGVDIRDLQLKWLRSQMALVSQEPVLFTTSIRENIKYGKEDATDEEVADACEIANVAHFIKCLPKGYDTHVGEGGIQLSGGQKQRMAIARAVLKNPRILLLDEATSALDAESENAVLEALNRATANRTTVMVAHRLSTVKNVNLIAVVQRGTIVEIGSHEELIQKTDSAYNQLIRLQEAYLKEMEAAFGSGYHAGIQGDQLQQRTKSDEYGSEISARSARHNRSGRSLLQDALSKTFSFTGIRTLSARLTGNESIVTGHVRKLTGDALDSHRGSTLTAVSSCDEHDKFPMIQETDIDFEEHPVPLSRLAEMNRPELRYFLLGILGSVGRGAVMPCVAFLLSRMIVAMFQPSAQVRVKGSLYAKLFLALGCLNLIAEPLEKICFALVGNKLVRRIRLRSFENVLRQEISWFDEERNSSAHLGAKLFADAAAVRNILGDMVATLVQVSTTVLMGLGIAFSASWELTLIMVGIAPFLASQGLLNMRGEFSLASDAKKQLEGASQLARDAIANIRTVASSCAEVKVAELYEQKTSGAHKTGVKQGFTTGLCLGFANFSFFGGYALCFYAGTKLVVSNKVTFPEVIEVFWTVALSSMGIALALGLGPDVGKAKPAVRSIFALLDRVSNIDPAFDEEKTSKLDVPVEGRIEFKHVSFRYPRRTMVPVFQDLSFKVRAGRSLALVGDSGSGKSTVVSLLERFYDVEAGAILIDGVDIRSYNLRWLRQNMGLVSQEPVLFDDTIKSNILYGKDGKVGEEELIAAAKVANAHAFISSLPNGYNTRVGERGVQLSGGQKQRVAIARAVIKSPKILLLDEATSALDSESEHVVQTALDQIMIGRTTVVVAHRLSTIRNCHQILVLKNGSIVEKGTYDELLKAGGAFASLTREYVKQSEP
ncbi:hypothetical protein R1flu_013230 [Riccia fluitans]|uniref:Uncharacterized protein n=1 Tax=Riccia fluitans TaxID=41844 RepID=A0ABD1YDR2_9MARC